MSRALNCLFNTCGCGWGSWRNHTSLTQRMCDHARNSAVFLSLRLVRRTA